MTKVLIAEDSATQVYRLTMILEKAGCEVVVTRDGQDALERVQEQAVDLVISDIMMPRLTGYELCRKIKADPATRHTPVMLLSTLNEPMDIINGLECGADNFLVKPYEEVQLINRVNSLLANKAMRAQARTTLGIDVLFLGKKFTIDSDRQQILDLLISIFEDTVKANRDLQKSQSELAVAKARVQDYAKHLEDQIRDRTAKLVEANKAFEDEIIMRKDTERELLEIRSFLDKVIEQLPVMLFVKDAATRQFVHVNKAGEQFAGAAPDGLVGKSFADIFPAKQNDRLLELEEESLATGAVVTLEEEIIDTPLNGKRLFRIKSSPVLDENGDPRYLLGFFEDITSHKEMEERLYQSQKMEAIGNLTGGLAHDFNNLLGVIIGNLDLLTEGNDDPAEAHELVKDALDAALRGADLTRRLLAFARRQPLRPEKADVNELVSSITKLLRRTLGEDIEIVLKLADGVWPVVVDSAQLESAITNLANNARDAMPKGGRLCFQTGNAVLDRDYADRFTDVVPGDYVCITVSDTGEGIAADVLERIFEPFFTTKEQGKGTGLGLSMVFGFIKQSGGHINVYSEVGVGTVFRIYLPKATVQGEAREASEVQEARPGSGQRVLLVEDNPTLRKSVTRQLQSLGYEVLEADTGPSALEKLNSEISIDLMFSDVVMPGGLNGVELARMAAERRPGLKVLLTSGFPDPASRGIAPLDGIRLLSKPYRKQELARAIWEVLTDVQK